MMTFEHVPVLFNEVIGFAQYKGMGLIWTAMVGGAGHLFREFARDSVMMHVPGGG